DRNGEIVKRVTSADEGIVEEPEGTASPNPSEGGENNGGTTGGNTGGNTGGDNGGDNGGGDGPIGDAE
ncbi:MAG: hypothetical protein IK144_11345, partial [Bacteroidaceae bacterium]|nr:hypothetical protein [Bacteroidaceae bacterium]